MRGTAEARFWAKVAPAGPLECWVWAAGRKQDGYGSFWEGMRNVRAHRWAYEHLRAPIPDGLLIDHLCRNRACVNPWHLEPVTPAVNSQRGILGQQAILAAATRTHCPNGHEYSAVNTIRLPGKYGFYRACPTCRGYRQLDPALDQGTP